MERVVKRLKSWFFDTDEEAKEYIESLTFGNPNLPKDVWVQILSSNKNLSVQDIQRMCRVNSDFNELCRSGIIWERIFIRQFGQEEYDKMKRIFADDTKKDKKLLMLLTMRYYRYRKPQRYNQIYLFSLHILKEPLFLTLRHFLYHDAVDLIMKYNDFHCKIVTQCERRMSFDAFKTSLTKDNLILLKGVINYLYRELDPLSKINFHDENWFQDSTEIFEHDSERSDIFVKRCIYYLLSIGARAITKNIYVGSKICASCAQPASSVCGRCHQAAYCDKECQRAHYSVHSQECE